MRIVTLTLNPALDIETGVEHLEPDRKLRCEPPLIEPGGGGINVARVVAELGGDPFAVVALGGPNGEVLAEHLRSHGLPFAQVPIDGDTRQSFTVVDRSSTRQYRFVLPGPDMQPSEWDACLDATLEAARGASCVVASGSMPDGVAVDAMATLARRVHDIGVRIIVDTSGPALRAAIDAPVDLVKPSANELRGIAGRDLEGEADYVAAARELLASGSCGAIAVSLGAAGALVVERNRPAVALRAPAVRVASTVGAGDSMVGAIAIGLTRGDTLVDAARLGIAAGTAAVIMPGTGLCRRGDVEALLPRVTAAPVADDAF